VNNLKRPGYSESVRALALILLASVVTACGGSAEDAAPSPGTDVAGTEKTVAQACSAGEVRRVGSSTASYAAVVQEHAVAFRAPGSGRLAAFGPENRNGVPTVFGVLAKRLDASCEPQWYRVQLPLKPNGITGWVRAADVELARVTTRILVDLGDREVTLYDRGRPVITARAAIGSPQTPTPTGRYYVDQRLVPRDRGGPFGPGAIGISAFSDVLTGWTQGGPIAIHGTNRPDLIGLAVSNGCVRVRNDQLLRIFERTRAGTPVLVRA
jgi:lipoprotein-anchoring transpeptidase ErfK/SrfK